MLLENFEAPRLPSFTDPSRQWHDNVLDKPLQALTRERLLQGEEVAVGVVLFDQRQQRFKPRLIEARGFERSARAMPRRQQGELLIVGRDQFPGAMPLIHQAFDQAQAFDLGGRVETFAVGVAFGNRKAITTFPHAQDVLGQPSVTFHGGYVVTGSIHYLS